MSICFAPPIAASASRNAVRSWVATTVLAHQETGEALVSRQPSNRPSVCGS